MLRQVALLVAVFLVGCGAAANKPQGGDQGGDDDSINNPLPLPLEASTIEDDGGALDVGSRASDGGASDAGHTNDDGAAPVACTGSIGAGDVKIVELMISSQSGSGDRGEWVELQNTRSCILNLNGMSFQSPRGNSTDSTSVTTDVYVQPGASFIVADSTSATDNHDIPSVAIVATFETYDVLKNDGDTVSVYVGSTLIDTLTYPSLTLTPGRSIEFPSDCAWSDRSSWARWSMSFNVWSTPFQGTPGADNTDVTCY